MTRFFRLSIVRATLVGLAMGLATPGGLAIAEPQADATIHQFLEIARRDNPEVAAARLRWEAAKGRTGYAGSLEEPRLDLTIMQLGSLDGPSLSLTQAVPLGNKRHLQETASAGDAEQSRADYERTWREVATEVKQNLFDIIYLGKAIQLHHASRTQLKNLEAIAATRYSVGEAAQEAPLRAQLQVAKLVDTEFDLVERYRSAHDHLNALLNRPLDTTFDVPGDFPAPRRLDVDLTQLEQRDNPGLLSARAAIASAQAEQAIAHEAKTLPTLSLGLEVGRTMAGFPGPQPMNYLGGTVGMNLPWLAPDRFAKQAQAADQQLSAAQAGYRSELNRLQYRVQDLLYQIERDDQRVNLYRTGIVSQAQQALRSALAGYQVGKVDFGTVLDSQMAVFDSQMELAAAQASYHKNLAQLDAELGSTDTSGGG